MNNSHLQKVLRLIKKTHDRVVVLDQASDDVVVLLRLEEYENLSSGTASQNQPLINPSLEPENFESEERVDDRVLPLPAEEEQFISPKNTQNLANFSKELDFSGDWAEQNATHSEPLDDVQAEEAEEKFYPEPVE